MTMDPTYMEAYFTEANVTRRRENALENLEQYLVSDEALQFLKEALSYSNELMEREIYAIKLINIVWVDIVFFSLARVLCCSR